MKTPAKRIVRVVWKDEGDFGFIVTYTNRDLEHASTSRSGVGVPYDPDRVRAHGSIEDARALALEHDAELVLT